MAVIGYIRHSKAEQGERMSPALQRRAIEKWATDHDHEVTAWFTDSTPGATPIARRPGLQQALAQLKKDSILLVYRLDRLARKLELQLRLFRVVAAVGARIVSTMDEGTNGNGDDDPDAIFLRQLQGALAERESGVTGMRIRGTVRVLKEQGRRWNGTPPYGSRWRDTGHVTDKGRPIIEVAQNVAEQRTIALVKKLRNEGVTYRGIVVELKRHRRVNRAGGPFVLAQVQRMLRRK